MKLLIGQIAIIFLGVMFSCTNKKTNTSTPTKIFAEKANNFYMNEDYQKAVLAYDTLILIDSTKGGYYFKRAYSKDMLNPDDPSVITDYFKAIKHNYSEKQSAYLNIGVVHRFKAIFRCTTDSCRIAEYDSALYFYEESLKINPSFSEAIREKLEVNENLRELKLGHWENVK